MFRPVLCKLSQQGKDYLYELVQTYFKEPDKIDMEELEMNIIQSTYEGCAVEHRMDRTIRYRFDTMFTKGQQNLVGFFKPEWFLWMDPNYDPVIKRYWD